MAKTFTQEQLDEKIAAVKAKEQAAAVKAQATAVKAETARVLGILKQAGVDNKEVESKEVKAHVANVLKELTASVKEVA